MFYRKRSAIQAELDSLHVQPPLARSAKRPRSRDRLTRLLYGRFGHCDDDVDCDVNVLPLTKLWPTSEQCSLSREAPEVSAMIASRSRSLATRRRSAKTGMQYANEMCKSGMQSGIELDKTIPNSICPPDANVIDYKSAEPETNDDLSVNTDNSSDSSSSDTDSDTSTSCDNASDYTDMSQTVCRTGDISTTLDDDLCTSTDSSSDGDNSGSSDNASSSNVNSDSSTSNDGNPDSTTTSDVNAKTKRNEINNIPSSSSESSSNKASEAHKQHAPCSRAISQKPYWIRRKFKVQKPLYGHILRKNLRRCGVQYWWPRDAHIRILIRDGYVQPDDDYNDDSWSDDSYSDTEDEMDAQFTYEELASTMPTIYLKHANNPTDQFHPSDSSMGHDDSGYNSGNDDGLTDLDNNSGNDDGLTDLDIRIKNIQGIFLNNWSGEPQGENSKDTDMQDDCVSNPNDSHKINSFVDNDIPMLDIESTWL